MLKEAHDKIHDQIWAKFNMKMPERLAFKVLI